MVYKEPQIIKNFLTHEECDFLINFEKEKLKQSRIGLGIDTRTVTTFRNSLQKCHAMDSDKVIASVMSKCSNIINIPLSFFEFINIVKYESGGFFKPHKDGVGDDVDRIATFLVYLNDAYEGGETRFPELNKTFKVNKGDAIFFHNFNEDFSETKYSIHEGCIVTKGEKWVANIWVHKKHIIRY
jgi:hypothetical protein